MLSLYIFLENFKVIVDNLSLELVLKCLWLATQSSRMMVVLIMTYWIYWQNFSFFCYPSTTKIISGWVFFLGGWWCLYRFLRFKTIQVFVFPGHSFIDQGLLIENPFSVLFQCKQLLTQSVDSNWGSRNEKR